MAADDEITVQVTCPHCGVEIDRTLGYLRTHRVLWCEICGQPGRYDDADVQRVEELLRQPRRAMH